MSTSGGVAAPLPSTGRAGAPNAGTWIANTVAVDTAGNLWVCTASGTPGTWTQATGNVATGALGAANFAGATGDGSGDYTTTSTTFVAVAALFSLPIAAAVNDRLRLMFVGMGLDVHVTSDLTLTFSVGGTVLSLPITYAPSSNNVVAFAIQAVVTVTAPMISGGLVTCFPVYRDDSGTGAVTRIYNESANGKAPVFTVENWLH